MWGDVTRLPVVPVLLLAAGMSSSGQDPQDLGRRCEAGDGEACFELGWSYHEGQAVPRDREQELERLRRGCDLEEERSCFHLCLAGDETRCRALRNVVRVTAELIGFFEEPRQRRLDIAARSRDVALLRHVWADGDPAVRTARDQRLIELVKTDPDADVRAAVLDILWPNVGLLVEVMRTEKDSGVRRVALEHLSVLHMSSSSLERAPLEVVDYSLFGEIARMDSDPAVRLRAVKDIRDQNVVGDVARRAKDPAVRKAAVRKLTNQSLLVEIAADDISLIIRGQII